MNILNSPDEPAVVNFRAFFSHIAPFVDQIDERQHYDVTLAG
ncbi:hypothetical protein [Mycolicibacterium sp. CBMA 226]|nr:hypothetical protein [Mycolicibacterium sp. CBMA 226]